MGDNMGKFSDRDRESFKYNFTAAASGGSTGTQDEAAGVNIIREQDRLLPIANVGRIMKQILPPNAKISKEAKETMQECVSEFVSFVTGEASYKCHKEKRKTVNGDDVCWALATLGFDDYAEPLKRYLHKYRELDGERVANQQQNNKGNNSGDDNNNNNNYNNYNNNNNNYNAYTTAVSSATPIGMFTDRSGGVPQPRGGF